MQSDWVQLCCANTCLKVLGLGAVKTLKLVRGCKRCTQNKRITTNKYTYCVLVVNWVLNRNDARTRFNFGQTVDVMFQADRYNQKSYPDKETLNEHTRRAPAMVVLEWVVSIFPIAYFHSTKGVTNRKLRFV